MPKACREAPLLVERPPDFEFRGGLFYVTDPATGIFRAYRPATFFAAFAAMAEVAREFRGEHTAEIIEFPKLA